MGNDYMTQASIDLSTQSTAQGEHMTLTLNQPAKRNALSQAMWLQLAERLSEVAQRNPRTLTIRGEGSAFCAGADISEFAQAYGSAQAAETSSENIARALDAIDALTMPTIAAIRGPCMGGGCALALACDLQIADRSARFGINPTALGTAYSFRDCQRLVARIGITRSKRLLMGAERIDATTAEQWGLISQVTQPDELDLTVRTTIDGLSARSPDALARVKTMLASIESDIGQDSEQLAELFAGAFHSDDFTEGTAAFIAKRAPNFAPGSTR